MLGDHMIDQTEKALSYLENWLNAWPWPMA